MLDGSPWGKNSPTILAILCSVAPLSALAMNLSQKKIRALLCIARVAHATAWVRSLFHYTPPGFPCIGHSEANNEPFEIDGTTWARAQLVTVKDYPPPARPHSSDRGLCSHPLELQHPPGQHVSQRCPAPARIPRTRGGLRARRWCVPGHPGPSA